MNPRKAKQAGALSTGRNAHNWTEVQVEPTRHVYDGFRELKERGSESLEAAEEFIEFVGGVEVGFQVA